MQSRKEGHRVKAESVDRATEMRSYDVCASVCVCGTGMDDIETVCYCRAVTLRYTPVTSYLTYCNHCLATVSVDVA